MLTATRLATSQQELLDPAAPAWRRLPAATVALKGTPLGTQPTSYMRSAWKDRKIGAVERVDIKVCHNGEALFIRLEWPDASENLAGGSDGFVDAAAVAFPLGSDVPLDTMGNEKGWVNAWQWRADVAGARAVVAHGLGTTEPTADRVGAAFLRSEGRWQVVLCRDLASALAPQTAIALEPGGATRFAVAVWEGSNGERAGFKAYTAEWIDLLLAET